MKVAIIHDWLTGMRGGERVLEAICELYPEADIFTLVYKKGSVDGSIEQHRIFESFINRFPFAASRYRSYLPLFPTAIEKFDLRAMNIRNMQCVWLGNHPFSYTMTATNYEVIGPQIKFFYSCRK